LTRRSLNHLAYTFSVAIVVAGCGGDSPTPPPDVVTVGDVTIHTGELTLEVDAPNGEFTVTDFIEVGTVGFFDEGKYYDPRDLDGDITWTAATRADSIDDDTGELILDNGVRLALVAGPIATAATLRVDASDVENAVLVRLVLPRDATEPIYGFGENFAAADASGGIREMQFRVDTESESSLNEAHIPVPLSLWPARGVGAFVEDRRPGAFDVGATRADNVLATWVLSRPGAMSAHLFTAADPLDLVGGYIDMTAPPAVPPMWAFAPQQWRNAHNSSQEVRDDAMAMRANDIPGSTMWIDNPWQTAYNDFIFDEDRFEEPEQLLADLAALGYRVLVWSTPYVNRDGLTSPDFAEAREMGYLVTDDAGIPFVFPWQDGPGSLVDFTADGATDWYRQRISRAVDMGISGFKLDFGEDVVPEFGGRLAPLELAAGDSQSHHAHYNYGYHEAYLGALPDGDGFLITRGGGYGDQAVNTCIWPGDLDSDFSLHGVDNGDGQINVGGLPSAIAGGLSLSASGYPFYGSDIGGFREGLPSTETLIRWSQYAALGTIMQLGGGGQSHNPWDTSLFDPPALAVYAEYSRLHMALIPYIYSLALIAGETGAPVTRPTRLVYPNAASDDATFLLGDAIFVAPVIEEGATTRDAILPPGEWIDWWTGDLVTADGATEDNYAAPLETLPLWRRRNAFVPMYAVDADTLIPATDVNVRSYADPTYGSELRLLITPTDAETDISLYDGATASASGDESAYAVEATAGASFTVFTLELDYREAGTTIDLAAATAVTLDDTPLTEVGDEDALMMCGGAGCWLDDSANERLLVRVALPDTSSHTIKI
jgi:alpha-D-xyloside xylohydrolase